MIYTAIEFLWDVLKSLLWWILLFPVILLLASPIILAVSLVGHPATYFTRVGNNFRRTFDFWADWGIFFAL